MYSIALHSIHYRLAFYTLIDGIYKFTIIKLYKLYAQRSIVSRGPVQRTNKRRLKLISCSLATTYESVTSAVKCDSVCLCFSLQGPAVHHPQVYHRRLRNQNRPKTTHTSQRLNSMWWIHSTLSNTQFLAHHLDNPTTSGNWDVFYQSRNNRSTYPAIMESALTNSPAINYKKHLQQRYLLQPLNETAAMSWLFYQLNCSR